MEITTVAFSAVAVLSAGTSATRSSTEGYRVRVATRDRERAKEELILLPTVDVVDADVHDPAALAAFVRGADAVINLVGVLHDGSGNASFEQAHVELARKVVDGVPARAASGRLLHMSALNADPGGPSEYLRSKGEAERIVRESGLAWTIFRPSVDVRPRRPLSQSVRRAARGSFRCCRSAAPTPASSRCTSRTWPRAFAASLEDVESLRQELRPVRAQGLHACASWSSTSARSPGSAARSSA